MICLFNPIYVSAPCFGTSWRRDRCIASTLGTQQTVEHSAPSAVSVGVCEKLHRSTVILIEEQKSDDRPRSSMLKP